MRYISSLLVSSSLKIRFFLFCFVCLIILNGVYVSCDKIKSNEMRFNKQELATLATQPSNKFEKEGILYVTERQDGFFRRSEGKHCMPFFLYFIQQMYRFNERVLNK